MLRHSYAKSVVGGTVGILLHRGFRKVFLEEVVTGESGDAMNSKSILRHGTTGDGNAT